MLIVKPIDVRDRSTADTAKVQHIQQTLMLVLRATLRVLNLGGFGVKNNYHLHSAMLWKVNFQQCRYSRYFQILRIKYLHGDWGKGCSVQAPLHVMSMYSG